MKRKLTAILLATVTSIGFSTVSFADLATTGSFNGTGTLEGYVDTEIVDYIVPTVTASDFNYIIDPQGLIAATNSAAHTGAEFAAGKTLYFQNDTNKYGDTSKALEITSKSSVKLDVEVTGKTTDAEGVTTASSKTFEDTTPAVYLALKSTDDEVAIDSEGKSISKTLDAVAESKFEFTYASNEYKYALKSTETDFSSYPKYSVQLTGACNSDADWTDLDAPTVTVTWNVSKHVDNVAPVFGTNNAVTYTAGQALDISYTEGTGTEAIAESAEIATVNVTYSGGKTLDIVAGGTPNTKFVTLDPDNNKITFTAAMTNVLDDGSNIVITYKLKTADGDTTTKTVNVEATKN